MKLGRRKFVASIVAIMLSIFMVPTMIPSMVFAEQPTGNIDTEATTQVSETNGDDSQDAASETTEATGEDQPSKETETENPKQSEMPKVTLTETLGDLTVKASAQEGIFPEGVKLNLKAVDADEETELTEDIAESIDKSVQDIAAVDITFSDKDGTEIQPEDGAVKISITKREGLEGDEFQLVHVKDNGKIETIDSAEVSATKAVFSGEHFSIYAIIGTDGYQDGDTVRRIYHFMQWIHADQEWKELEGQVQILKNGDKLLEPKEPSSNLITDTASDDEQFRGWVLTGKAPGEQGEDVSSGTPLEYGVVSDIDESAQEDEEVYAYAHFERAYKAAFFDQLPDPSTPDVGIVDIEISTDYEPGEAIDVSRISEALKTAEGKAVTSWYLMSRGGAPVEGFPATIPADDKTTLVFSELDQTVILYPNIVDAYTVTFDKNDSTTNPDDADTKSNASFTSSVKVAPGIKINKPTDPIREGYTFGGWYENREGTGSAVDFSTRTYDADTTFYAKWIPENAGFRVILWTETFDEEVGKEVPGRGYYSYVATNTGTEPAGTQIDSRETAERIFNKLFTQRQISEWFPYHETPDLDDIDGELFIAGDGSTIFNVYFDLTEYTLTFNVNNGAQQGTIIHTGDQPGTYHGSQYSFKAKMGQDISRLWPTAAEVQNIGRYSFKGWTRPGNSTLFITKRDKMVPELLNRSGSSYVNTTFTANYSTGVRRDYVMYYLQSPTGGNNYELSDLYTEYINSNTNSTVKSKEIEGFTFVRNGRNGQYDSSVGAYVYEFYYNRNQSKLEFFNYGELDKEVTGILHGADISNQYYEPQRPATLDSYYTFDGWYLDQFYQARYDNPDTHFAGKTMHRDNLALYAKWTKGNITVTFDENYPGGDTTEYEIEAETKLSTIPDDPSRGENWEFLGWYDESGKALDLTEPFDQDTTFKAKWKSLEKFRVKYEQAEGEQGEVREDIYLYFDGTKTSINKFKDSPAQNRPGYNFVGWEYKVNPDGKIYHENEMIVVDANRAVVDETNPDGPKVIWLKAVYSEGVPINTKVTFDGNGGTHNGQTSVDVDATVTDYGNIQNNEWTTPAGDYFTYTGKRFVEWNTKADGSGISFAPGKAIGADIVGSDLDDYNTLYAIWESAEADFTINYYQECLPGDDTTDAIYVNGHYYKDTLLSVSQTGIAGEEANIPALLFEGNTLDPDATGAYIEAQGWSDEQSTATGDNIVGIIRADGTTSFNFFYTRNKYKVTYTYAGTIPPGANPTSAELAQLETEYVYGETVTVAADAVDDNDAYDFTGWHSTDVPGDVGTSFTMPKNDVQIFGVFTPREGGATAYIRYYVEIPNGGKVANVSGASLIDPNPGTYDLSGREPSDEYNFIVAGDGGKTRYYELPSASSSRIYEVVYPATVGETVQAPPLSFAGVELDLTASQNSTDFTQYGTHTITGGTVSAVVPETGTTYVSLYYNLKENPVNYTYMGVVPSDATPAAADLPSDEMHKYGDQVEFESRGSAKGHQFYGWLADVPLTVTMPDDSTQEVPANTIIPAEAVSYTMPNSAVNLKGQFAAQKFDYMIKHYQELADQSTHTSEDVLKGGIWYRLVEGDTETKNDTYGKEVTASQKDYQGFHLNSNVSTQKGTVTDTTVEDMLVLEMFYDRNLYKVSYVYAGYVPDGVSPADPSGWNTDNNKFGTKVTGIKTADDVDADGTGYTFDGWYDRATGQKIDYTEIASMPAVNLEFYGKFVANEDTKYYVTHWKECVNQQGHSPGETGVVEVNGIWYAIDVGATEEKTGTTDAMVTATPKTDGDYANFTYNEADSEATGTVSGDPDEPLVLNLYYKRNILNISYSYVGDIPASAQPTQNWQQGNPTKVRYGAIDYSYHGDAYAGGYTFKGWYYDEDCTDKATTDEPVTEEFTVYGKFEANDNTPYEIRIYYMSEGLYPDVADETIALQGTTGTTVQVDDEYLIPDDAHRGQGYSFDEDTSVIEGTILPGREKLIMRVYFRQTFDVNYLKGDYGDFTEGVEDETSFTGLEYGTSGEDVGYAGATDDSGNPVAKSDAEFLGWIADVDVTLSDDTTIEAGELISSDDIADIVIDKNINFTAQWHKMVKLTFVLNGGTMEDTTEDVVWEVEHNEIVTMPEPTREGYTFDYWKGSKYYAGDSYKAVDDHTFYAVWKSKSGGDPDGDNDKPDGDGSNTGDDTNIMLLLLAMLASLTLAGIMVIRIRQRRNC